MFEQYNVHNCNKIDDMKLSQVLKMLVAEKQAAAIVESANPTQAAIDTTKLFSDFEEKVNPPAATATNTKAKLETNNANSANSTKNESQP